LHACAVRTPSGVNRKHFPFLRKAIQLSVLTYSEAIQLSVLTHSDYMYVIQLGKRLEQAYEVVREHLKNQKSSV